MIIGDFNTTLDYSRDRKGYSKTIDTHKNCRALIKAWIDNEKWVHAFDYHHPGKKSYTWESKQNSGQEDRNDHYMVSPNLIKHTKAVNHTSIGEHLTDHRAIEMVIDWAKAKRGKGNFRAKIGIEKNLDYQQVVKDTIKSCLLEYLDDNNAREYLSGKMDNINKLEKKIT